MDAFLHSYEHILHNLAEVSALTLEFIGVFIIIIGSFKSLIHLGQGLIRHRTINIVIELGKTLALALEFSRRRQLPGQCGLQTPDPLAGTAVAPEKRRCAGKQILTVNAGFGGLNSVLLMEAL